jgi:hypothetical protein
VREVSVIKRRRLSEKARNAAELEAAGIPVGDICARVPIHRATLRDLHAREDYRELVERKRGELRASAEAELGLARPEAVRALRGIVRAGEKDPTAVDARALLTAATALLGASQPPSESQRARARLDLLRSLPAKLRRDVVAALDAAHSEWLAGISDDELDRLLAEGDR